MSKETKRRSKAAFEGFQKASKAVDQEIKDLDRTIEKISKATLIIEKLANNK